MFLLYFIHFVRIPVRICVSSGHKFRRERKTDERPSPSSTDFMTMSEKQVAGISLRFFEDLLICSYT